MTESEEASIDRKVEELLTISRRVKLVLDTKTIAVICLLIVGAVLIFQARSRSNEARVDAHQALIQSVINERENLDGRLNFLQTRDCPVEYLQQLLVALQQQTNLTLVPSPCAASTQEIDDVQGQINAVNKRLASLQK